MNVLLGEFVDFVERCLIGALRVRIRFQPIVSLDLNYYSTEKLVIANEKYKLGELCNARDFAI